MVTLNEEVNFCPFCGNDELEPLNDYLFCKICHVSFIVQDIELGS